MQPRYITKDEATSPTVSTCANGSMQPRYITKDEATSPTVSNKAMFLTSIIEAKQGQDVLTVDTPNTFV